MSHFSEEKALMQSVATFLANKEHIGSCDTAQQSVLWELYYQSISHQKLGMKVFSTSRDLEFQFDDRRDWQTEPKVAWEKLPSSEEEGESSNSEWREENELSKQGKHAGN